VKNRGENNRNTNPIVQAQIVPIITAVIAAINPVLLVHRRAVTKVTDRVPPVLQKVAAGLRSLPVKAVARVLPVQSEVVDKGKSRLDDSFYH
jgi:hypothetical protein